MAARFLNHLRTDMSQKGLRTQRRYVDCTREGPPPLRDDDEPPRPVASNKGDPSVEPVSQALQERQTDTEAVQTERLQVEWLTPRRSTEAVTRTGSTADFEHEEAPPRVRARQQEREEVIPLFRGARTLQDTPSSSNTVPRWTLAVEETDVRQQSRLPLVAQKGAVLPEELPAPLLELFKRSRRKEEEGIKGHLRPWSFERDRGTGSAGGELLWFLQLAIDYRWLLGVADVKGEFAQTNMKHPENVRTKKVFIKLPWQGLDCFPGTCICTVGMAKHHACKAERTWFQYSSYVTKRIPLLQTNACGLREQSSCSEYWRTVVEIRIIGTPPVEGGYALYCDASLANLQDQRTQVAMVLGRINRMQLRAEGVTPFSLQDFVSHKFRRVVSSTVMAEASALVKAFSGLMLGEAM
eukprot:5851786-Amphidinium_carterae.1